MPSPFVTTACTLWEDIIAQHVQIFPLENEYISYSTTPSKGAHPTDAGDTYAQNRVLTHHGVTAQTHITLLKQKLEALQMHLLPMTILGADSMTLELYHEGPKLSMGPWAHYGFHVHDSANSRGFVKRLCEIAQQDGTQHGSIIPLNFGGDQDTCRANSRQNAKDLFDLCQEDIHIYSLTGHTDTPKSITLPDHGPIALPAAVWSALWASVKAARAAGIQAASVDIFPHSQGIDVEASILQLSPAAIKKLGNPKNPTSVTSPQHAILMDAVKKAVMDIHAHARAIAPILTTLDAWTTSPNIAQYVSTESPDHFFWGGKTASFQMMQGGGIWGDRYPIFRMREPQFQYAFERALGMLSTLPATATQGWLNFEKGTLVPGDTLQDALLLSAALASGQKPQYVPGAHLTKKDLPNTTWHEAKKFP
jgi:hypothetical protein